MGRRSAVSVVLFLFPVVATVAVLVGLETTRAAHGQAPLFAPPIDNSVTTETYCQVAIGVTPLPGRYTFNPNQWGANGAGNLCMNITTHHNETHPTNTTASAFTATWAYPQGPLDEPVHAFPNAKLELPQLVPVSLNNLSTLDIDVSWSYAVGDVVASSTDDAALVAAGMNANVCLDMFLDADPTNSASTNASAYEVMVWLGAYGLATQPIGLPNGSQQIVTINQTSFDLYYGSNGIGQKVFTWIARGNTTEFGGDISPLIVTLSDHGGPTSTDNLGYVAFGSEALYSLNNVTFAVPELMMNVSTK